MASCTYNADQTGFKNSKLPNSLYVKNQENKPGINPMGLSAPRENSYLKIYKVSPKFITKPFLPNSYITLIEHLYLNIKLSEDVIDV